MFPHPDADAGDATPKRPGQAATQWVDLTARPSFLGYVRNVWRRRDMAVEIARNNLRSEHVDAALGEIWFLLNPLLLIGVYWLVFGEILQTNRGVTNFVGFLAVGIFTFDLTRTGLLRSSKSLVANRGLMSSLSFPRALLPVAVTLEQTYTYLPQIVVTGVILLLTDEPVMWSWLMVPVLLAVQTLFTLGGGLIVARLGHHAHDTSTALPFVMRLAFYLSGILFSFDEFWTAARVTVWSERLGIAEVLLAQVAVVNPFYCFVTLARHYLMASSPSPNPLWLLWASVGIWTVVLLVVGLYFFRGAEREYGRD